MSDPARRRGVELVERGIVLLVTCVTFPVFAVITVAIKLEGLLSKDSSGPVFFTETRISRGDPFDLIKFRTLKSPVIDALGPGPTHIKRLERNPANLTRCGRLLKKFYLDELPQLLNIVKGQLTLVGTRPWPIGLYEEELARGVTRKRDMPAGMLGPVQAAKGDETSGAGIALDLDYYDAYRSLSGPKLLALDLRIALRCIKVMIEAKGL